MREMKIICFPWLQMKIIFIGDTTRERERKSENKMNKLIASSKSRDLKFVMIIYI